MTTDIICLEVKPLSRHSFGYYQKKDIQEFRDYVNSLGQSTIRINRGKTVQINVHKRLAE